MYLSSVSEVCRSCMGPTRILSQQDRLNILIAANDSHHMVTGIVIVLRSDGHPRTVPPRYARHLVQGHGHHMVRGHFEYSSLAEEASRGALWPRPAWPASVVLHAWRAQVGLRLARMVSRARWVVQCSIQLARTSARHLSWL